MDINQQGPKSQDEYEIARLRAQVAGQQERIAELEEQIDLQVPKGVMLAQMARIAELREALSRYVHIMYEEDYAAKALSRTDDLSALVAHDAEVKKATLLEAAAYIENQTLPDMYSEPCLTEFADELRHMAEGEQP